jgi:hypothetical protein
MLKEHYRCKKGLGPRRAVLGSLNVQLVKFRNIFGDYKDV